MFLFLLSMCVNLVKRRPAASRCYISQRSQLAAAAAADGSTAAQR